MPTPKVRVWDRFVRFFHWSLAACVLVNFFVTHDGKALHQWLGYIAVGLVTARIVWGFIGPRHARFADFLPTPSRLRTHLRDLVSGRPAFHAGHNPLGGIMVILVLALVLSLGLTGYLQTTDRFFGEEWLQDTHEAIATMLIGLAGLHVAAAIVMSRLERINLVAAMITGIKQRRPASQRG
jgi:cytochrome b